MVIVKAAFLLSLHGDARLSDERTSASLTHFTRIAQVRLDGRRCASSTWRIAPLATSTGMAMASHTRSDPVRSRLGRTDLASENFRCVDGIGVCAWTRCVLNLARPL